MKIISLAIYLFACFVDAAPYFSTLPKCNLPLVIKDVAEEESVAEVNVGADVELAVDAFAQAFVLASDAQLVDHFGPSKDVRAYYKNLLQDDDIKPFREGQMRWMRAYVNDELVGIMIVQPDYHESDRVYLSTLAVKPAMQNCGLGRVLISSIVEHWYPSTNEIVLIVRSINDSAMGFYEHLHFHRAPEIDTPFLPLDDKCLWMRWRKIR